MGKRIVKNYPSPRLMDTIGATNQKPAEAIGELVANSFDARCNDEKLLITIDMRNNQIVVTDNGKGMTSVILEKAVCIAQDMSLFIERGIEAKGHFGMGFKTSCATLGEYYEIFTRPNSCKEEYHVAFDINDYKNRPNGAEAWDIEIEDIVPSQSSPLKKANHGTSFVIKKLKDQNITVSSVLEYMGEAFKNHIDNGDVITIIDDNGTHDAIPKEYEFIKGTKIIIDEKFGPKNKYHITGWMALDSQTHNNGHYGFNIYRHNQLVETNDKTWFRAHLMTSRIMGEVNLDFLDATFYKQGLQQSEDWQYVKQHMSNYLKGIVSASQNISRRGNIRNPSEMKQIIKTLHVDYNVPDIISDDEYNEKNKPIGDEKATVSINDNIKNVVSEESLLLEGEGKVLITYFEKQEGGNIKTPFDYIFEDSDEEEKAELQVILYKNHPLWKKKIDDDVRRIIATSDAIYRMLVEKIGFDTSKALKIRNQWIEKRSEGMK